MARRTRKASRPHKYSVLYVDPPWAYNDKNANGARGASFKYSVLKPKQIIALPMQNVMADDCAVFLWTTAPMLPEAIKALEAWGAPYRTIAFNWVKTNKTWSREAAMSAVAADPWQWLATFTKFGLGHWTRSSAEFCLLGVRGRPKRAGKSVRQAIFAPALEHSAKPPEVRDRIVELMNDVPRLELFARDRAIGWDATGLEYDGHDVRDFLGW